MLLYHFAVVSDDDWIFRADARNDRFVEERLGHSFEALAIRDQPIYQTGRPTSEAWAESFSEREAESWYTGAIPLPFLFEASFHHMQGCRV